LVGNRLQVKQIRVLWYFQSKVSEERCLSIIGEKSLSMLEVSFWFCQNLQWPQFQFFSFFCFHEIIETLLSLFYIPVWLISRQVHTWSTHSHTLLMPKKVLFLHKVNSLRQSATTTGWSLWNEPFFIKSSHSNFKVMHFLSSFFLFPYSLTEFYQALPFCFHS